MNLWQRIKQVFYAVPTSGYFGGGYGGLWGQVMESFAGAWQKNVVCEKRENILAFSPVFSCATLIASDVSKLRPRLMEQDADGVWSETQSAAFSPVLRKPNPYQTRIQFLERWVLSKLLWGNTYVLKRRDRSGIVRELYILDPRAVTPQLTEDGGVYYYINQDFLNRVPNLDYFPATEVIHDRGPCLFHPLVGVSVIYACASSATQGIRVQAQAAKFWENMARPSGQLTTDKPIDEQMAAKIKARIEEAFSGGNLGRFMVAGDGLHYEPISAPAVDSQLVEQLNWTAKDVARAFRIPGYKIGVDTPPQTASIAALNQEYYSQTLQNIIESIELLLDEGLDVLKVPAKTYGVELDLDGLLRMDQLTLTQALGEARKNGIMAPNEARLRLNLKPVRGGDTPYLQQQDFSLAALDKRDAQDDPFAKPASSSPPALPAPPTTPPGPTPKEICDGLIAKFAAKAETIVGEAGPEVILVPGGNIG